MNMRKENNLKMAEVLFCWYQSDPSVAGFEARMYFYLFKWAGYTE